MSKYTYTTVDRIFSKFSRDLRNTDLHESDVIEWIGEALEFLKVREIQTESIAFLEVKNYETELPVGFQTVIQIARNNRWVPQEEKNVCQIIESLETEDCEVPTNNRPLIVTDCQGNIINEDSISYYRPRFDLQWEYNLWTSSSYYKQNFSLVRLSNHSFFNSVVCKETNPEMRRLYEGTSHEYTLVDGFPTKKLRFNFKEGQIAMAYLKTMVDDETGYPLIPDNIQHITAITYYIKWKMAERLRWDGREGFAAEAKDAEDKWLKYVRQAINKSKMPEGEDQYQRLMDNSLYLIPRTRKFYGFFGNLGKEENRMFNNPNRR